MAGSRTVGPVKAEEGEVRAQTSTSYGVRANQLKLPTSNMMVDSFKRGIGGSTAGPIEEDEPDS